MTVKVERIVGWDKVLNDARATVGKPAVDKEPSDLFKTKILISEHSPIRKLLFEVTWEGIPYWVAMHFRTHHMGFKSAEDDLYFIQTQRTDRTQRERNSLPQDAPVLLRAQINAQSLLNVSRVRLCRLASIETRLAWEEMLHELSNIESMLTALCVPNCIYRGFCPEAESCKFFKTGKYEEELTEYRSYTFALRKEV
jgi:hypothetical protein